MHPAPDVEHSGRRRVQRDADWRSSAKDARRSAVGDVSQMLKGKAFPDGFRDKVDKMVDNMDEEKVGYWALSDLRNESFVRKCLEWTITQVLHGMSAADIGSWCESAVDILKELLTSMHLTGGGESERALLKSAPSCSCYSGPTRQCGAKCFCMTRVRW